MLDNEITQNMQDLNHDMVLGVSNVLKTLDLNAPDPSDTLNVVIENLQNVLNFNTLQVSKCTRPGKVGGFRITMASLVSSFYLKEIQITGMLKT